MSFTNLCIILLGFVSYAVALNCNIGVDCSYALSSCDADWCIAFTPHGSVHTGLNCDIMKPNSICEQNKIPNGHCGYVGFIQYCCCNEDGCNNDPKCPTSTPWSKQNE
uniref:Uncharacterized protein n=1 Tax=Plectus sambesii TaxID=2011161 RepID=A0A914UR87_9BILA